MKYLVDENISKSNKFLQEHPNYKNVKYELGQAVKDQEIMKYAKDKEDYVLITQDKNFALDALIAGLKVLYKEQNTDNEYRIVAKLDEF